MKHPDESRRQFLKRAAMSASALGAGSMPVVASPRNVQSAATSTAMPHRVLGRTGERVPILHLGTSQRLNPSYDKVLHRSFKNGVTWFDTALSYGWGASHRAIANFLWQMGDRKNIWLTSKSGSESARGLTKDLDEALEELKTDYLDLYLMHGIERPDLLDREFLQAGEQLKRSGKTRYFGFSCHDGNVVELLQRAAKAGGGIDAILFRYNFRRYGDRELNLAIDACHKAGIGLLAMKTMGSVPENIEKVVDLRFKNFTVGQAKLKSVWADERIASICSEMDSVRYVRENVAAAKSEVSLTAEETHHLNQLAALTAAYSCNGCSHLCESAIGAKAAIAAPLRFLMYYECYGKRDRARDLYRAIPEHQRRCDEKLLVAAGRVCPQGIDIAGRLRLARELLT